MHYGKSNALPTQLSKTEIGLVTFHLNTLPNDAGK